MSGTLGHQFEEGTRCAGIIIGFLVFVFACVLVIESHSFEYLYTPIRLATAVVGLCGLIISRKKIWITSMLFFVICLFFGIMAYYYHFIKIQNEFYYNYDFVFEWMLFGLPYLIASILLFISWRLSKS